jgi:ABC-type multidrug transport system fused ATPase/permease subunit
MHDPFNVSNLCFRCLLLFLCWRICKKWVFEALFNRDALSRIDCQTLEDHIVKMQHMFLFFERDLSEKVQQPLFERLSWLMRHVENSHNRSASHRIYLHVQKLGGITCMPFQPKFLTQLFFFLPFAKYASVFSRTIFRGRGPNISMYIRSCSDRLLP